MQTSSPDLRILRMGALFLFLSFPFGLFGQDMLGEIAVTGTINNIQVFPYGDSVLVTLQQEARADVELMAGTYMQKQTFVPVTAGVLYGAIGGAVIALTVESIHMSQGQCRYFFTRPNSNREFDFVDETKSLSGNAKVDHYELVQKHQYSNGFDVKDYLRTRDGAIGLYYSTKSNTISIVKFGPEMELE